MSNDKNFIDFNMNNNYNELEFEFINGTEFYFDLDAINDFIFKNIDDIERENEIVNNYEFDKESSEFNMSSKVTREIKKPNKSQNNGIKYDLIRLFLEQLLDYNDSVDLKIKNAPSIPTPMMDINYMPTGKRFAFNTFVQKGFLKKINKE